MKNALFLALALAGVAATGSASATSVGLYGPAYSTGIISFLNANGYTAFTLNALNADSLASVDAVLLFRNGGNAALSTFVQAGGMLITEYSAANYGMSLFGGAASDGGLVGTGTTVAFTTSGIAGGLSTGQGASFSSGGSTEFFNRITTIGSAVELATQRDGATAIAGGSVGTGYAYINAFDWADDFGNGHSPIGQLLLAELTHRGATAAAEIPEPASIALFGAALLGFAALRRNATKK